MQLITVEQMFLDFMRNLTMWRKSSFSEGLHQQGCQLFQPSLRKVISCRPFFSFLSVGTLTRHLQGRWAVRIGHEELFINIGKIDSVVHAEGISGLTLVFVLTWVMPKALRKGFIFDFVEIWSVRVEQVEMETHRSFHAYPVVHRVFV